MDTTELLSAIYQISKEGTKVALAEIGLVSPELTQAEAWRIFRRKRIERLIQKKEIHPRKIGGSVMYSRREIVEAIMKDLESATRESS